MTTGRNHPCTCGSGRKYKHCCLRQHAAESHGSQEKQERRVIQNDYPMDSNADISEKDSDERNEDLGSVLKNIFFNLHEYKLKKLPHIKEYKRLRKIHREITTGMADYLYDGKFKLIIDLADKTPSTEAMLKLLTKINSDPETDVREQAFYDIHFYKMTPNSNSITEAFMQPRRYRRPDKIAMLENMLNSAMGLYEVISIDSDQGYVSLQDVFTHRVYKVIDLAMSVKNTPTDVYIYRRIITADNISFGAGVALLFKKTDKFIRDFIRRNSANYHTQSEIVRFYELYNHHTTASDSVKTASRDIR